MVNWPLLHSCVKFAIHNGSNEQLGFAGVDFLVIF